MQTINAKIISELLTFEKLSDELELKFDLELQENEK